MLAPDLMKLIISETAWQKWNFSSSVSKFFCRGAPTPWWGWTRHTKHWDQNLVSSTPLLWTCSASASTPSHLHSTLPSPHIRSTPLLSSPPVFNPSQSSATDITSVTKCLATQHLHNLKQPTPRPTTGKGTVDTVCLFQVAPLIFLFYSQ